MIIFTTGDILDADCAALVNTVNTVGVMGKGIALQFKRRYPTNYHVYREAHKAGALHVGELLITQDSDQRGDRTIINFPTKQHWRNRSEYAFIESGLATLRHELIERKIKSVAIPPLGCGQGGLEWTKVRDMIEAALVDLPTGIKVYEPNAEIRQKLREAAPLVNGKLTPARAMLLRAQYLYEREGEHTSLFVAVKLAYFLQRLGEPLRLNFTPHYYGPYAPEVAKVLQHLNGAYLRGMEQGTPPAFETLELDYARVPEVDAYIAAELTAEQRQRLARLDDLLNGFESAYSLEVLATVDFLKHTKRVKTVSDVTLEASKWSTRKREMLQPHHVKVALEHLARIEVQGELLG